MKMELYQDFKYDFLREEALTVHPTFAPMVKRKKINEIFKEVLEYFPTIIKPIGGWVKVPMLGIEHDKVVLEGNIKLGGGPVARFMVGSEFVIIMGCTIGTKFDQHLDELQKQGKYTEATLVDTLGSFTVSQCSDQIETGIMKTHFGDGYNKTPHCEPGSTDWHIKEQKIIFSILDGQRLGIRLSDSMMMYPSKSVTSMFGIGKGKVGILDGEEIKCQYCANRDKCTHGRITMEKYPSKI
jgi:hypothetical protein